MLRLLNEQIASNFKNQKIKQFNNKKGNINIGKMEQMDAKPFDNV